MKRTTSIVTVAAFILMVQVASAKDHKTASGMTVSDPYYGDVRPIQVDEDLSKMTVEEFRAFCARYNGQQVADAHERHEEYVRERDGLPAKTMTANSGSSNTRVGGGLGMGGYGGAGGYAGYGNIIGVGGYGGGGYGGAGIGGGVASQGNNVSSSYSNESSTTTGIYPDLNDDGGGPVTIINPYCYDYWCKQPGHYRVAQRLAGPQPTAQAPVHAPAPTETYDPSYNPFAGD